MPTHPVTRLVTLDDASTLARILDEGREFFAPWDPLRDDRFFTVEGQRSVIEDLLERHALGQTVPCVILNDRGDVAGRITLDRITFGAFQSCGMGYWVAPAENGRGLATAAVAAMVRLAFDDLHLHRVEAGTLPHNTRSQRVLERNGFTTFGMAPDYLHIAGRWQDHVLFQRVNPDWSR